MFIDFKLQLDSVLFNDFGSFCSRNKDEWQYFSYKKAHSYKVTFSDNDMLMLLLLILIENVHFEMLLFCINLISISMNVVE